MQSNFSKKLKELREERGLYQKDLSEQLGLSVSTISGYELGTKKPKTKNLKMIANFFGVTTDYLIDNNYTTTSELEEEFPEGVYLLRRAVKELTKGERERLVKIIEAFLR